MVDRFFADEYLAGVYDAWHARDVRDDYDFYLPLIMSAKAVLDVGCGTGTLLHEARRKGHSGRLCGLDPGFGMLERARQVGGIEWVLGEIRSATWAGQFDLVVMTGHAFQALLTDENLRDSLAAVRRALVPGGRFAFETRNPAARAWEQWSPENAVTVSGPDGGSVLIATAIVAPFDGRTITFAHTFSGDHASLPQVSRSTLRFLDTQTLQSFLAEANLAIETQFGDFQRGPLSPTSPEIVTLARAA